MAEWASAPTPAPAWGDMSLVTTDWFVTASPVPAWGYEVRELFDDDPFDRLVFDTGTVWNATPSPAPSWATE